MCVIVIEKEVMNFNGVERKQKELEGSRTIRNYINTVHMSEILKKEKKRIEKRMASGSVR